MRKNNILVGIILILIGSLYLINIITDIKIINFAFLWPLLLFFIGLNLEINFYRERSNGSNLIPGGILMVLGVFFFIQNIADNKFSQYTWAVYALSVAVGFLQYYFLYKNKRMILILGLIFITIFVLKSLSVYFQTSLPWLSMELIVPIIIIAIGLLVIIKR